MIGEKRFYEVLQHYANDVSTGGAMGGATEGATHDYFDEVPQKRGRPGT
jgi:hypothetical protein